VKHYAGIIDDVTILYGCAWGTLRDSQRPREFPDGSKIQTSEVVYQDSHIVETRFSIYFLGRRA
jgi:hypothetical protein